MSGRSDVVSGRKERCNASQDAQNAGDTENPLLASGRNADRSDAASVFADESSVLPSAFFFNYATLPFKLTSFFLHSLSLLTEVIKNQRT